MESHHRNPLQKVQIVFECGATVIDDDDFPQEIGWRSLQNACDGAKQRRSGFVVECYYHRCGATRGCKEFAGFAAESMENHNQKMFVEMKVTNALPNGFYYAAQTS